MQKTDSQTGTIQQDPGGKHGDRGVPAMCQAQPEGLGGLPQGDGGRANLEEPVGVD